MHDDEAVVVSHIPGEGRCANMMGAIMCKDNLGVLFKIGTGFTDQQRKNPPKIGSKITFKY
jgi:DNA ligase-1